MHVSATVRHEYRWRVQWSCCVGHSSAERGGGGNRNGFPLQDETGSPATYAIVEENNGGGGMGQGVPGAWATSKGMGMGMGKGMGDGEWTHGGGDASGQAAHSDQKGGERDGWRCTGDGDCGLPSRYGTATSPPRAPSFNQSRSNPGLRRKQDPG